MHKLNMSKKSSGRDVAGGDSGGGWTVLTELNYPYSFGFFFAFS